MGGVGEGAHAGLFFTLWKEWAFRTQSPGGRRGGGGRGARGQPGSGLTDRPRLGLLPGQPGWCMAAGGLPKRARPHCLAGRWVAAPHRGWGWSGSPPVLAGPAPSCVLLIISNCVECQPLARWAALTRTSCRGENSAAFPLQTFLGCIMCPPNPALPAGCQTAWTG